MTKAPLLTREVWRWNLALALGLTLWGTVGHVRPALWVACLLWAMIVVATSLEVIGLLRAYRKTRRGEWP